MNAYVLSSIKKNFIDYDFKFYIKFNDIKNNISKKSFAKKY